MGSVLSRSAHADQLEAEVRDADVLRPDRPVLGVPGEAGRGASGPPRCAAAHDEHGPTATARLVMVRDGAVGAGSGGRVPHSVAARSRDERREGARDRATLEFGDRADAALDLLELLELAWHDSHGDAAPPTEVVEDVWAVASGDLARAGLGVAARRHRLARPAPGRRRPAGARLAVMSRDVVS